MTAVAWWTLGTAVFVMAAVAMSAGFRLGPVRWAGDALARRREAELRAEKLLLSWLSPSQRDQYRSRGWFDVVSRGGNRYRICPWKVTRLDIPRCAYCIEAVPRVPGRCPWRPGPPCRPRFGRGCMPSPQVPTSLRDAAHGACRDCADEMVACGGWSGEHVVARDAVRPAQRSDGRSVAGWSPVFGERGLTGYRHGVTRRRRD